MKDRTLILDLGNVLIHVDVKKLENSLKELFGFTDEGLDRIKNRYTVPFNMGTIKAEELFEVLNSSGPVRTDMDSFIKAWTEIFTPDRELQDFIAGLERSGLRIVIASNTDPLHISYIRENIPLSFSADEFLSYEQNAVKPDDAFYKKLIDEFDIDTYRSVFFDDLQENVDAALRNGIRSYVHTDNSSTIEKIKGFLEL